VVGDERVAAPRDAAATLAELPRADEDQAAEEEALT
jgi:hypothetical protein